MEEEIKVVENNVESTKEKAEDINETKASEDTNKSGSVEEDNTTIEKPVSEEDKALAWKEAFENKKLFVRSNIMQQMSYEPYAVLYSKGDIYPVEDFDLEDKAYYITNKGNYRTKIRFDDEDFELVIKEEVINE